MRKVAKNFDKCLALRNGLQKRQGLDFVAKLHAEEIKRHKLEVRDYDAVLFLFGLHFLTEAEDSTGNLMQYSDAK